MKEEVKENASTSSQKQEKGIKQWQQHKHLISYQPSQS